MYGVDPADGVPLFIQDAKLTDNANTRTVNGVKVTTDYTRAQYAYVGSAIPKFFGSFNSHLEYKGFYLDALFTYQWGGLMYDLNYSGLMIANPNGKAASIDLARAWKNPGDITDVPKMTTGNAIAYATGSTRWLLKTDYISLRTATLGYNFDKQTINDLGLTALRFYLSGENLWAKTAKTGIEPAQSFVGNTSYRFTPARIISFGVNANF